MISGGATSQGDYWVAFYRWTTITLLTLLIGVLGYFGRESLGKQDAMAKSLADISQKMVIVGFRGDENRDDIAELKASVRDIQAKVNSLHGAVSSLKAGQGRR